MQLINGKLTIVVNTMQEFANYLASATRENVFDETDLLGGYQFEVEFDPATLVRIPGPWQDDPDRAHLPAFATVLRAELGLVLERAKRPVPMLVVTRIGALREN